MLHTLKRHVLVYAAGFALLGGGTAYAAGTIYSSDIVDGQVKSVDIADNGVTGVDVNETTLDLGCRPGVIHGFARVKGSDDMENYWRTDNGVIDTVFNCRTGATVSVRRESTGVYYVRFDGTNPSRIAVANPNTDGAPTDSPAVDNIVSVSRVEPGVFRVETVDVNDEHSGDTDPQDIWFTLMLL